MEEGADFRDGVDTEDDEGEGGREGVDPRVGGITIVVIFQLRDDEVREFHTEVRIGVDFSGVIDEVEGGGG